MSNADQCPSSKKEGKPAMKPRAPREVSRATGKALWRSAEDLRDTPAFREYLEREFPALASEADDETRRNFLRVMGASLALAGAVAVPGCRRPDHKILTYARDPEHVVPGNPLFYATAMPLPGGGAEGVLARTYEGRPVKIEGNPLHPINRGKTDAIAQASVLDLYDVDRSKAPAERGEPRRWQDFAAFARATFPQFDASGGEGLAFLVDKQTSPSRDAMRDRVKARWPKATWTAYESVDREHEIRGSALAFGTPVRTRHDLSRAKVVVSLGREFLDEPGALDLARGFMAGRTVNPVRGESANATMNRLYVAESGMTLTGAAADHRVRVKPSEAAPFAMALLRAVLSKLGAEAAIAGAMASADAGARAEWIDAVADDLIEHRGASVVMVGEDLPAEVHAAAHVVNAALGAVGTVVSYLPMGEDEAALSSEGIAALTRAMSAGAVKALVVMGCNPVYTAPADLDFAAAYAKVPLTVHHGMHRDETGSASTWHVNAAHYLESWGDAVARDGTLSPVQPMIAPLFEGRSQIETLAAIVADDAHDGYGIVRRTWAELTQTDERSAAFEKGWRRALHDGLVAGSAPAPLTPRLDAGRVASALSKVGAPGGGGVEIVFRPHPSIHDGRNASNGWLQELPHPMTKVVWDNPALLSPGTMRRLGLDDGDAVTVSLGGRSVRIIAWSQPGQADDTVVLELGFGRRASGRVGDGVGFDVHPLRTLGGMRTATGAAIDGGARMPRSEGFPAYTGMIACTAPHHSMEGRPIIHEVDLAAFRKHGDEIQDTADAYGIPRPLNFAGRLGTEAHTPTNRDVFLPRQQHPFKTTPGMSNEHTGRAAQVYPAGLQQWGMSVDLTTCTGCGSCVVACQAENNIPIVGKPEVHKQREMHWIRVDRYYAGDADDAEMVVQPIMCVHCENAPCEVVCPVNATVHGPEGTNDMAYNRCIGTRYCSNNCPYKVRRFNWFDYATKQFKGDFGQWGKGISGDLMPRNENFVPPRLREKVNELRTMQYNPRVTVRSRGVMEKCTYCIQRINAARVETKLSDLRKIPDGFFEVACEQACPTGAIVFGDITDPQSRVSALRGHGRTYLLLAYLNTVPRTSHMVRLRNPNPRIRQPVEDPFHHGEEHGAGGGHGGEGHGSASEKERGHVMSLPVLGAERRRALGVIAGALA